MSIKEQKRPVRKSLSQRGPLVITGEKDKDFEYRVVNDTGSRVQQLQGMGYELVTDESLLIGENRVSDPKQVGSGKRVVSKDGTVSYLMRIKKEWYDEDQKAKQAQVSETELSMQKDATGKGMYGGIKTSRD